MHLERILFTTLHFEMITQYLYFKKTQFFHVISSDKTPIIQSIDFCKSQVSKMKSGYVLYLNYFSGKVLRIVIK